MAAHTSALEVARYVIWLAANDRPDEPMYVTDMQLVKLLFYVQGWCLVERSVAMFDEALEAWRDGAVVYAVYQEYKIYGKRPITDVPQAEPNELVASDKEMVRAVWNRYKKYSALGLSDLVHEDQAWLQARGGLKKSDPSRRPIRTDLLRRSFNEKLDNISNRLARNWDRLKDAADANTRRLTGKPAIGG